LAVSGIPYNELGVVPFYLRVQAPMSNCAIKRLQNRKAEKSQE